MVATANSSFMEDSELPQVQSRTAFFWTMVALAALDIILLFWLLNPVSKSADDFHRSPISSAKTMNAPTTRSTVEDPGHKPSPLGGTAARVTRKLNRNRNIFTTVGYDGR